MSTGLIRCGPIMNGIREQGNKKCNKKCPFWERCQTEVSNRKKWKHIDLLIKIILKDETKNARP